MTASGHAIGADAGDGRAMVYLGYWRAARYNGFAGVGALRLAQHYRRELIGPLVYSMDIVARREKTLYQYNL